MWADLDIYFHFKKEETMNKYSLIIICTLALLSFISCEKDYVVSITDTSSATGEILEDSADYIWDSALIVNVVLNGNSITAESLGVTVSGSKATITSAGTYNISGSLTDGQIIVNTEDEETVRLILNGVNITCSTSAPVYVSKAKKTIIVLADNTENYVTDGASYKNVVDGEPNAAIFSKSDLTIFGNGSLIVDGNYADGISSKDGLIIKSGTIAVTSVDDGIRGKDYLVVHEGNITINAGGDGLKSDNEENTLVGFLTIDTAIIKITSAGDAMAAQTNLKIENGEFNLISGGGSSKTVASSLSAKGIKGIASVTIDGGTFTINSADDALHSNANVEIKGSSISISSNDDGIHADKSIEVNNSYVNITKSFEGIESASITIDNSNIWIVSSDDGFNATAGLTPGGTESNDGSYLYINSGYVCVNASGGDAIDSNGNIVIKGGTVVAHGPLSQPEVGMDYNGSCTISGGMLIVSGISSNMTQAPSTSSSQYSLLVKFTSSQSAKSIVHIQDSDGNDILTFAPLRSYQSIILSSPKFIKGNTYTIFTGGSSTGTVTDGLYVGGIYSGGTSYQSFTISSIITTIGSSSGGGGRP
jgi:hypothetical protein